MKCVPSTLKTEFNFNMFQLKQIQLSAVSGNWMLQERVMPVLVRSLLG